MNGPETPTAHRKQWAIVLRAAGNKNHKDSINRFSLARPAGSPRSGGKRTAKRRTQYDITDGTPRSMTSPRRPLHVSPTRPDRNAGIASKISRVTRLKIECFWVTSIRAPEGIRRVWTIPLASALEIPPSSCHSQLQTPKRLRPLTEALDALPKGRTALLRKKESPSEKKFEFLYSSRYADSLLKKTPLPPPKERLTKGGKEKKGICSKHVVKPPASPHTPHPY